MFQESFDFMIGFCLGGVLVMVCKVSFVCLWCFVIKLQTIEQVIPFFNKQGSI
jgi:hypothetical protein